MEINTEEVVYESLRGSVTVDMGTTCTVTPSDFMFNVTGLQLFTECFMRGMWENGGKITFPCPSNVLIAPIGFIDELQSLAGRE